MRLSVALRKLDPNLLVQRRLPGSTRKQQQRLGPDSWREDRASAADSSRTPAIVVQIAQAARQRRRSAQLWQNLLGQALESQDELAPRDMASVLWSMGEARFRHDGVLDEFVRSLSHNADVRAAVTAMLALDRLGLPTDSLRAPFLQQLSGNCEALSLTDLRRVLMALSRCWRSASPEAEHAGLLEELCSALASKAALASLGGSSPGAAGFDPRDLLVVPQYLGRLRFPHPDLVSLCADSIATLVRSRLAVLPLDALRALDGLRMLERLPASEHFPASAGDEALRRAGLGALAAKCRLLAAELLRGAESEELWAVGSQLLGAEISEPEVWSVWASEALAREAEGAAALAQRVVQLRRRAARRWRLPQAPEGLELALSALLAQQRAF